MKYSLLICGLLVATVASAEPGTPGKPARLKSIDTDGDKQISLAEAQANAPHLAAKFNELDVDHDGYLSMDEVKASHPVRKVRVARSMQDDFAAADANADGRISRAEAQAGMPIVSDFFEEMDGNADGHVTQEEIHAHARANGPIRVIEHRDIVDTDE